MTSPSPGRAASSALVAVLGLALLTLLVLPVFALLVRLSPRAVVEGLGHPAALPALRLSLATTSMSLLVTVLLGTPLAWRLARARGAAMRAVEAAVQLPIVIPPAVAGVALLLTFGRQGLLTGRLYPAEWSPGFSTTAVVLAEIFVSAPYYVEAAVSGFRRLNPDVLLVARTLGASPLRTFFQVALPLSAPALAAGIALSWARALGEFGATLMFAGSLRGETETMPLAIYATLESDLDAAVAVSSLLVCVAFTLLLGLRAALGRALREGPL